MSKKMLGDIMREAQKLQAEMTKMQEEAKKKTVEASAGGGMVTVVATGAGEIVSIKIEKDVVNPEDVDDDAVTVLAHDIAQKLEKEAEYAGQIKVTVIREVRASDTTAAR